MCVVRTTWTYPRTSKLMMDFVFISLVVGCTFRSHHSAFYFVYFMRLSLHILFINVFFHLHIHIHFHIHVLSVVAVAVLIVIVVIVLQVEVDTTSWNSCIAACDWQIGFHLLRQMQDIKLERCAHTYRIYIYIYKYTYIISHRSFVVHLYNYTNAYIIYLYLKKRSAKPGFAELQMLRFAWPCLVPPLWGLWK